MYNDLTNNNAGSGTPGGGPGHSLGGASGSRTPHHEKPLSANELRERRLAALGGSTNNNNHVMDCKPPPATPPASFRVNHHDDNDDDEVMDPDLQAALRMSLQSPMDDHNDTHPQQQPSKQPTDIPSSSLLSSSPTSSPPKTPDNNNCPPSTTAQTTPSAAAARNNPPSVTAAATQSAKAVSASTARDYNCSVQNYTDITSFHSIMWDSVMTTDNDKQRWVGQGISTRIDDNDNDTNAMNLETPPSSHNNSSNTTTTTGGVLGMIGSNHKPWGLTQTHGGPCGVLAAVQAEMLRLLLFGGPPQRKQQPQHNNRNDTTANANTNANANANANTTTLEYPTILPDNDDTTQMDTRMISEESIKQSLAMSLGIILARSAIVPSASEEGNSSTTSVKDETNACVQIVLPRNPSKDLSWDDLEPWSSSSSSSSNNVDNTKLRLYTISNKTTPNTSDAGSTTKRQRKNSPSSSSGPDDNHDDNNPWQHVPEPREERIIKLSKTITNFLLHPREEEGGVHVVPLDSFRRPGGVLLLVMSLVASRGRSKIQSDFDDTHGTKLTSQFGHSSQELINVLLTGQAVSNVFDNTLKPSGDLTCRGIQSRPVVGYLSQLESLRYCEVGGYYKFPRFPVWVVGSTSHFTVMFGGPSCLKESESDVLLEKCRRAFKKADGEGGGTGENGFINTNSLGKVLTSLELNVGGDSAVQTLAATLEVGGAGIILWDDFWKATSRLMTGASLETVLQGNHHDPVGTTAAATSHDGNSSSPPPLLITQNGEHDNNNKNNNNIMDIKPSALPPPPKTMAESDEELARRLAAEWGNPVASTTNTTGTTAAAAAAARPASPMDVDPTGMSDEDFARKLQAQWDAESGGTTTPSSTSHNNNNVVDLVNSHHDNDNSTTAATANPQDIGHPSDPPGPLARSPSGGDAIAAAHNQKLQFESFGNSFPLFHYNGLRGGSLTPFRVTRLSAEEAVGASIALSVHSGASGGGHPSSAGGGDLEDVVRTKWPSSMIDWLGNKPPYID